MESFCLACKKKKKFYHNHNYRIPDLKFYQGVHLFISTNCFFLLRVMVYLEPAVTVEGGQGTTTRSQ